MRPRMRRLAVAFVLLAVARPAATQSPYRVSWRDAATVGVAARSAALRTVRSRVATRYRSRGAARVLLIRQHGEQRPARGCGWALRDRFARRGDARPGARPCRGVRQLAGGDAR